MATKKHRLIEIDYPDFGQAVVPQPYSSSEYLDRIARIRDKMEQVGLTHLVVYGDREHFANLAYLTGLDPRFEESILILAHADKPLILVGNECESYLNASTLFTEGHLRSERYQTLSLISQPRDSSRKLVTILSDNGIRTGAKVGCVGWKYFSELEFEDPQHSIELPSFIVDVLRRLVGTEQVVNASDLLMHPQYGLKSVCSVHEIAHFEYANMLASEGMKRILFGMRDGIQDVALAELAGFNGMPLGCHMVMLTEATRHMGLVSPRGNIIRQGEPFLTNVCYWGGNIARGGWVVAHDSQLPLEAQGYAEKFAGRYFEAGCGWLERLKIGVEGGVLYDYVHQTLPDNEFGVFLNPGHLIHLDEWVSSPIFAKSSMKMHSGMAMQLDIIPTSPHFFTCNMEDGYMIADANLQTQLRDNYPDCMARCEARRTFMRDTLGIAVPNDILPLSNISAMVSPYLLAPNTVFAL